MIKIEIQESWRGRVRRRGGEGSKRKKENASPSSLKSQKPMKTKLLLFILISLALVRNVKLQIALFDSIFIVL